MLQNFPFYYYILWYPLVELFGLNGMFSFSFSYPSPFNQPRIHLTFLSEGRKKRSCSLSRSLVNFSWICINFKNLKSLKYTGPPTMISFQKFIEFDKRSCRLSMISFRISFTFLFCFVLSVNRMCVSCQDIFCFTTLHFFTLLPLFFLFIFFWLFF